jgi:Tol biopolymer transport system component
MHSTEQLNTALAGRYAIERQIGEGGMATVYLARDVRHNRSVALKVLKPDLGAIVGVERFLSEITVTANLQHPNLLPLFDSGEVDGVLFYVMPYIEGESLRARLDREKQLPIENAIHIATAIASALDYAHRRGVIHRDLKPENILMHDGQPLVADFGIALAVSNAGGSRITQTGLSLGTPQYMSPEQATGDRAIDGRTDIYSLGALTYEMLGGEAPHTGSTSQAIIARVLTEKPRSLRATRASVPVHVEAAVERALEKLPADRWATAKEFAESLTGLRPLTQSTRATGAIPTAGSRWRIWAAALTIGAALGAASMLAWRGGAGGSETPPTLRAALRAPAGARPGEQAPLAFSPDGKRLVQVFVIDGVPRLYLLTVGDEEFKPLAGTEGASAPFFSPNGEWIAFFQGGSLRKISVNGGLSVVVADALNHRGGSWGPDDSIVFAPGPYGGLIVVAASGGPTRRVSRPDSAMGSEGDVSPEILPGGKAMIFTARGRDLENTYVIAQRFGSTERKTLVRGGAYGRYVPSGHLVFSRGATLMAVRFDAEALEVAGEPTPVAENLMFTSGTGGAANANAFAIASTGLLVYVAGGFQPRQSELVWIDRGGKTQTIAARRQDYWFPRLSPRGDVIAVTTRGAPTSDIWLYDHARGDFNKVTFEGANWYPVWSPKGDELVFQSIRGTSGDIYRARVGGGKAERLTGSEYPRQPMSWSPDGQTLAFVESHAETGLDIWLLPLSGDRTPKPWLRTKTSETYPAFSPDSRWLAYSSNESGRSEVYVQPVSPTGEKWLVSLNGGTQPVWSRNGRELFYQRRDSMVVVPITPGPGFAKGTESVLFHNQFDRGYYDVGPDGRFLHVDAIESPVPIDVRVVVNWFDELRRLVPDRR